MQPHEIDLAVERVQRPPDADQRMERLVSLQAQSRRHDRVPARVQQIYLHQVDAAPQHFFLFFPILLPPFARFVDGAEHFD